MAIHFTIESQAIVGRTVEREARRPRPTATFCERERPAARFERHAVARERIIGSLEHDLVRRVEDQAAPAAVIVVQLRRPDLAVHRQPLDVPDAVEHGLRPPAACQKLQLIQVCMPSRYAPSSSPAIAERLVKGRRDVGSADVALLSPPNPTHTANSRAVGTRRITAITIRCVVTSFTPMSNVRLSSSTWAS